MSETEVGKEMGWVQEKEQGRPRGGRVRSQVML